MLWKRVISACIFVPVLLISMYVGGLWWFLVDLVIIVLGLREYTEMLKLKSIELPYYMLCVCGILVVTLQTFDKGLLSSLALIISIILLLAWVLYKEETFASLAFGIAGIVLIAWTLATLVGLWYLEQSWKMVLMAFLIPWLTDTGAYACGRFFGKRKLAPVISPNKTWEGAIGGVVISMITVCIYNALVMHYHWWFILLMGLVGSVAGQLGDLMESWLKRWVGVKDSGNAIPGHGGVLDRFDSMLFVAPIIYFSFVIYLNYCV